MAKNKYTKIGAVLNGEYGPFLVLGDTKGKPEYQYTVKMQIENAKGEKLQKVNPLLSFLDPRNAPVKEGKEPRNVPDKLLYEVFIIEKTETENLS